MRASDRPPHNPAEPRPDVDPFWTHARRTVFLEAARRFAAAIVLGLLAAAWAIFAAGWLINRAVLEEPEPSGTTWLALLLPAIALFALSVLRLVERRAPPIVRVLGVLYAIVGTVAILSLLDFA